MQQFGERTVRDVIDSARLGYDVAKARRDKLNAGHMNILVDNFNLKATMTNETLINSDRESSDDINNGLMKGSMAVP